LKALELIDRVHSKEDVEKLSGGQQQRLAFARAIVRDFTVLFGDEPTGNLDPVTADNVMNLLKMKLQPPKKILDKPDKSELPEEENFASAIIVSHSFDLALKFADIIVKIQTIEEQEERYGLIDQNSIFIRNEDTKDIKNSWKTSRGIISNLDLQDKLMKNGD
jgi:ABC-type phosphate/phosphonate transport system ATPase subunit